ncbi:MAG TPA: hypothetical protein VJ246_01200 [Patescibacteria group bacterium]|nr:hypothetical protein [Patescibacteria group bacterium]
MIVFRTTSPKYVRQSKDWKSLIGKHGTVLAVTHISAQGLELTSQSSYPLALVEFTDKTKQVLPGIHGETLTTGDQITCVLRKMRASNNEFIIEYGIKIAKSPTPPENPDLQGNRRNSRQLPGGVSHGATGNLNSRAQKSHK